MVTGLLTGKPNKIGTDHKLHDHTKVIIKKIV
jgi:hypothetical protein